MYRRLSVFVPGAVLEAFRKELAYLGIDLGEKQFVGFLVAYGIALSAGISANLHFIFGIPLIITLPVCFLLFFGGTYLWLGIVAESRGRFVEKVLPDALQLIASNMRAGLTTERAMLISAREEFGPLGEELKAASKRILTGETVDDALSVIPNKIHSHALERTVWLLCQGVRAGGQMADLLAQLSDDLRAQLTIEDEIKANISIYVMLILFAAILGAPLLFGVSTFISEVLSERMGEMPVIPAAGGGGMLGGIGGGMIAGAGTGAKLSPEFVLLYSQIALAVTTFFASITIGVINSGSEKAGMKMLPVLLVVVFAVFFVIRAMLATMFSQLL